MTSNLDLVLAYHRAWTSGDVDGAMAYVADDVVCHAPGRDLSGKEGYRAFLAGFAPNLTRVTDIAQFAEAGDRVALFYYPETAATSSAPAAECFTLRDGVIAANVLIFDRLSFGPPSA